MVVGAFALTAWGRPRATLDLDFIIQTTEVPENLIQKLRQLGFRFDEVWETLFLIDKGFPSAFVPRKEL